MKIKSSLLALSVTLGLGLGCSSKPTKVDIAADANPANEVASFQKDLKQASEEQVDVLSPENFKKAESYSADAASMNAKSKPKEKIFESVGQGRAYLRNAIDEAGKVREAMPEVVKARSDALLAGAQGYDKKGFQAADDDLRSEMKKFSKSSSKVDTADRDRLNKEFLQLELIALKKSYLGEAHTNIDRAKENKAAKFAPKSLALAEQKLAAAERVIETDRHNASAILPASNEALAESRKLVSVTGLVKDNKKQTGEDVALAISADQNALNAVSIDAQSKEAALQDKDSALKAQSDQLNTAVAANAQLQDKLSNEEKYNQSFEDARKQFSKSEADVYRQGPNLLIRLKALDFKSGASSLSKQSFSTLGKVKNIIKDVAAQKVVVEGHTDSTGKKATNEKISKERAETVAHYLVSEEAVEKSNIETEGYGFEKPIASNKTKAGRAQNRRVDIIITPSATAAATTPAKDNTVQ